MEFIIALIVFPVVGLGMAIGYIFRKKPITGSCGGLNNITGSDKCEICGVRAEGKCTRKSA